MQAECCDTGCEDTGWSTDVHIMQTATGLTSLVGMNNSSKYYQNCNMAECNIQIADAAIFIYFFDKGEICAKQH